MSEYHKFYNIWKAYTSKKKPLNEVSDRQASQILNWIASKGPEDYSFDNIFGNKMRIIIPLEFKEKNIDANLRDDYLQIKSLINLSPNWKWDKKSLTKGSVYRIKEPKDFGPELNLKRYGSETPPPGKRVEQKISKFLNGLAVKADRDDAPDWLKIRRAMVKRLLGIWNKVGDKKIAPQGSIIISRHPVDVARMSDFSGINSCHTPGSKSGYYKCAVNESRGNAPVAFYVSEKALNKFLGDKDISEFDKEEIFADPDRNLEGINPTARLRLRKFTGQDRGGEDFELAIPEIQPYGNDITHFQETINDWAYSSQSKQFYKKHHTLGYGFQDRYTWKERYIQLYHEAEEAERRGRDAEADEKRAKMRRIGYDMRSIFPNYGDGVTYHGGTYLDSPDSEMFKNFFGIEEYYFKRDQTDGGYTDNRDLQHTLDSKFLERLAKKYYSNTGYTMYDWRKNALEVIGELMDQFMQDNSFQDHNLGEAISSYEAEDEESDIEDELENLPDPYEEFLRTNPEMIKFAKKLDKLNAMASKLDEFAIELHSPIPLEEYEVEFNTQEVKNMVEEDKISLVPHMEAYVRIPCQEEEWKVLKKNSDFLKNLPKEVNKKIIAFLGDKKKWQGSNIIKPYWTGLRDGSITVDYTFLSSELLRAIKAANTDQKFEICAQFLKNHIEANEKFDQIEKVAEEVKNDLVSKLPKDDPDTMSGPTGVKQSLNENFSRVRKKRKSLKILIKK